MRVKEEVNANDVQPWREIIRAELLECERKTQNSWICAEKLKKEEPKCFASLQFQTFTVSVLAKQLDAAWTNKESMQSVNTDLWLKSLRNIVVQKKKRLSVSDTQSVGFVNIVFKKEGSWCSQWVSSKDLLERNPWEELRGGEFRVWKSCRRQTSEDLKLPLWCWNRTKTEPFHTHCTHPHTPITNTHSNHKHNADPTSHTISQNTAAFTLQGAEMAPTTQCGGRKDVQKEAKSSQTKLL